MGLNQSDKKNHPSDAIKNHKKQYLINYLSWEKSLTIFHIKLKNNYSALFSIHPFSFIINFLLLFVWGKYFLVSFTCFNLFWCSIAIIVVSIFFCPLTHAGRSERGSNRTAIFTFSQEMTVQFLFREIQSKFDVGTKLIYLAVS